MNRLATLGILWGLILFLSGGLAAAQLRGTGAMRDMSWKKELDVMLDTPIPGETLQYAGISSSQLEKLLGKRIMSIEAVRPPKGLDPVRDLNIESGAILTRELARQMVMTLWESGKYRHVQISARESGTDGVVVLVRVEPMFRVSRLVLEGNEALSESEIKRAIGYAPGGTIVPESEALIDLRDRLLNEYGKRGYNDATASVRLETTDVVSELALLIDVAEGTPDEYVEVKIVGLTEELSQEQLLRASGLKRGIIRDEEAVQDALSKLSATLFELGYPDARILDEYSTTRVDRNRYSLTIHAVVGLRTLIEFSGNDKLRRRDLQEEIWQPDFRSDARGIEKSVTKLKEYALSKGLFHAEVVAYRRCYANPQKWYTVSYNRPCENRDVTYQAIRYLVKEGPQVEVVDILIDGARHLSVSDLRDETFAFIAEQNREDVMFEPLSTRAVNDVVAESDDFIAKGRPRGTRSVYERPESIYHPNKYFEAMRHLEDIYAEQGFMDARVSDACVIEKQTSIKRAGRTFHPVSLPYSRDAAGETGVRPCVYIDDALTSLLVQVTVTEGVQTLVENIDISGNTPAVFTRDELLDAGKLHLGQPYNEYFVRDAADLILKAYQERGYMFANVTWNTALSEDGTAARIAVRIEEGPQVRVNRIVVNSDRTNKWFIENNLGFESGDLVTPTGLTSARQRVMDMGVFNSATVQMQSPGIVSDKKNILVTVVERRSQYLELRAGAATEQGVRGGFEYGHRNIAGLAINYRLKIRANYRPEYWFLGSDAEEFRNDLDARYYHQGVANIFKWLEWYVFTGFRTSNIPGTSGLLGTGVDVTFENLNRRGFSALKITPKYRLTSHYLRFLPIELSTGVDGTIVLPAASPNASIAASTYSRLPKGKAVFWVTGLSVALDFRDSPLDPKEGVFLALKGEYVHSLDKYTEQQIDNVDAKSRYIRFMSSLSGYIPFSDKRNVLALSTTVGYMFHISSGSSAWADRYFYMGGVGTLRGFKSDTLFPQDLKPLYNSNTGDLVQNYGGEAMFLLRAELRHDFGKNIVGVVFGEVGNIWRNPENFLRNNAGDFSPFLLRPTSGLGIHYNTPVGPLAFDVGVNLNRNKDLKVNQNSNVLAEALGAWYFSIGSAF
jgi:outer membrane protein insertion porin family